MRRAGKDFPAIRVVFAEEYLDGPGITLEVERVLHLHGHLLDLVNNGLLRWSVTVQNKGFHRLTG